MATSYPEHSLHYTLMTDPQPKVKVLFERPATPRRWPRVLLWVLVIGALMRIPAELAMVWLRYYTEANYDRCVARIRARGEPLAWKDFPRPSVPDEQNAALLYIQAMGAPIVRSSSPSRFGPDEPPEVRRLAVLWDGSWKWMPHPKDREEHYEEVQAMHLASRDLLDLCRRARQREGVDWKLRLTGQPPALALPAPADEISNHMRPMELLELAAWYAHRNGDDANSLEYVRDLLAFARSDYRLPGLLHTNLAERAEGMAMWHLMRLAGAISLSGDPSDAKRRSVGALISDLLNDRVTREGWVLGMMGERAFAYSAIEQTYAPLRRTGRTSAIDMSRMPWEVRLSESFFRAAFAIDSMRLLSYIDRQVALPRQPDYARAKALGPTLVLPESRLGRTTCFLTATFACSWAGNIERCFSSIALRRLAAAGLAIRMYQADHGGKRPATLEELVPDYLPAVPVDPFAADGRAIRYEPNRLEPLLYSVYKDGKDDGGDFTRIDGRIRHFDEPDLIFLLDGDEPAPPR